MISATQEANKVRDNFHNYYIDNIAPVLYQFEELRKTKMIQQSVVVALSIILILGSFLTMGAFSYMNDNGIVLVPLETKTTITNIFIIAPFLGLGGVLWAYYLGKKFEKLVKRSAMPVFLKFFGDFVWTPEKEISNDIVKNSKLVGYYDKITPDDYFEGTYKDSKIIICECALVIGSGKHSRTLLRGPFVKIEFNKEFRTNSIVSASGSNNKIPKSMSYVEIDNQDFCKDFCIHSENETLARELCSEELMNWFKNLKSKYKTNDIRASFSGNSMIFAINNKTEDFFQLADLRKPFFQSNQMQELFEQFFAIISVVDVLKNQA